MAHIGRCFRAEPSFGCTKSWISEGGVVMIVLRMPNFKDAELLDVAEDLESRQARQARPSSKGITMPRYLGLCETRKM